MDAAADVSTAGWPDWMLQARQAPDWGLLLALAFSLIAAFPFLAYPTLPHTNASENYVYRTADTAAAFTEGRLYARWSPHALNGYGAPIPHYYPPGATYLAAVMQVLFTDDAVTAVRLVFVIGLALSSIASYRLVARRVNAAAGLLAAYVYTSSPYVGLTTPHLLGDLPLALALGLLPLLLLTVDRLISANHPLDLAMAALTTAALALTHPGFALIGLTLAMIFGLGLHGSRPLVVLRRVAACGLLGLGAASFFWLPAWLEADAVHWLAPAIPVEYRLALPDLFQPVRLVDPGQMVPEPQFTAGLFTFVLALLGAAYGLLDRRGSSFALMALVAGGVISAAGLLFIPHQTDLLGIIALCLAIASGNAIRWRDRLPRAWRRLALPALLAAVWISSTPVWIMPRTDQPFGGVSPRDQIQYEQLGYGTAVLPAHLPVPSTLNTGLLPNRQLVESYLSGVVNRIALDRPEIGVQIGLLETHTHSAQFQVRADSPLAFTLLTAHFPGWRATLNERSVPLFAEPQTGLIRIELPVIRGGELRVLLDTTSARTGAWVISACALGMILVITWGSARRWQPVFHPSDRLTTAEQRLLVALWACLLGVVLAVNLPSDPVLLRPRPGFELENARLLETRTDAGLGVLAYRLDADTARPGDLVELTLFWQAQRALTQNYQALVYLLNTDDGSRWAQFDYHHPGGYPTGRWLPYRHVRQQYRFSLPPAMPPGVYQVTIEVSSCLPVCSPRHRLTFFDANGQMLGPVLYLPTPLVVKR